MSAKPYISIVICTFNRAASLRRTLASLLSLRKPSSTFELVVVDNNSSDDTAAVVQEHRQRALYDVSCVFEHRQGQSNARNRGASEARGDIVAFTDDDTLISEDWLLEIEKAFETYSDAVVVGGKILPEWEARRPAWLVDDILEMLAVVDHGDRPLRLETPLLFGANFVCRARMLSGPQPFDPGLGRVGRNLRGGEETAFQKNILLHGGSIYYIPSLVIRHVIDQARVERNYFRKYAFWNGRQRGKALRAAGLRLNGTGASKASREVGRLVAVFRRRRGIVIELRAIHYLGMLYGFFYKTT